MKVMYWNIIGIANMDSHLALMFFCLTEKPDIIFIFKPKFDVQKLPFRFENHCGMKFLEANSRGDSMPNLQIRY